MYFLHVFFFNPYSHVICTQPDSSDQLRRSHVTKYRCGYCKLHGDAVRGTLHVLPTEATVQCSSFRVPLEYPHSYSNFQ